VAHGFQSALSGSRFYQAPGFAGGCVTGEILSSEKGKTLTGIINFHPMVTDHVEPPLLKHPSE